MTNNFWLVILCVVCIRFLFLLEDCWWKWDYSNASGDWYHCEESWGQHEGDQFIATLFFSQKWLFVYPILKYLIYPYIA